MQAYRYAYRPLIRGCPAPKWAVQDTDTGHASSCTGRSHCLTSSRLHIQYTAIFNHSFSIQRSHILWRTTLCASQYISETCSAISPLVSWLRICDRSTPRQQSNKERSAAGRLSRASTFSNQVTTLVPIVLRVYGFTSQQEELAAHSSHRLYYPTSFLTIAMPPQHNSPLHRRSSEYTAQDRAAMTIAPMAQSSGVTRLRNDGTFPPFPPP